MTQATQNDLAKHLRSLHTLGRPLILTNVYDGATALAAAAHASTRAIATTSYAIAATAGLADDDLTQEANEAGIARVVAGLRRADAVSRLPLTVDLQDGYADPGATVKRVIALGAVGCNIEDLESGSGSLRSQDDAVTRIREVADAAKEAGMPDFCINARTDVLAFPNTIVQDAVARGKAYLAAGATTVLVWGGSARRGLRTEEVATLAEAFDGRLNVIMKLDSDSDSDSESFGVQDLSHMGVARISVGPRLFTRAMQGYQEALEEMLAFSSSSSSFA